VFKNKDHDMQLARLLFGALALLLLAAEARAETSSSVCGPYRVAFYEFGRFYFHDEQGLPRGIDPDLIAELARRSGCTLQPELNSRARIWEQLSRGQLDITVSGIATPEREQLAEFWPYLRTRNHALMRKSQAVRLPSPAAFLADPQRRVVVVKSFRHGPALDAWLEQLRAQGRVHEAADFETALRVYRAGRVDLMLAHPINLLLTEREQQEHVLLDWAPGDDVLASLVVSRQRVGAADRERLHAALNAMLADGSVDAILQRHLGERLARGARLQQAGSAR
jgi:polar amino acid transport system substrate-binding protein